MQMNLEDLDGKIKLFETAAAEYLAGITDLDQSDLDEMVTDAFSGQAADLSNEGADYEEAQSDAEERASSVNNRGAEIQIACLMALGLSVSELDDGLRKAAAPELS